MSRTPANTDQLDAIIADYLKRVDRGELVDRSRFILSHHSLAAQLQEFFADLDQIERQVETHRRAERTIGASDASGDGDTVSFVRLDSGHAVGGSARGARFGDFDLLEELGRGGMGIVFKARQRSLNRTVCIKMMLMSDLALPPLPFPVE